MKTGAEFLFLLTCEFEDGGEWYHLDVDMAVTERTFYRCRIKSMPDSILYVNDTGRLRRSTATEVTIDVAISEEGQWVDLDFGSYALVEKLGQLIEHNTL